jgi:hypothetical protein
MRWKRFGKKLSWHNLENSQEFFWKDWGKPRQISIQIAGIPYEFRTKHLLNMKSGVFPLPQSGRWRRVSWSINTFRKNRCVTLPSFLPRRQKQEVRPKGLRIYQTTRLHIPEDSNLSRRPVFMLTTRVEEILQNRYVIIGEYCWFWENSRNRFPFLPGTD